MVQPSTNTMQTQHGQVTASGREAAAPQQSFWNRKGVHVAVGVIALGASVVLVGVASQQIAVMLLAQILHEIFPIYFEPVVFSTAEILKPIAMIAAGTILTWVGVDRICKAQNERAV